MLTTEEYQHYDRHLIIEQIGIKGQLKLKKAKVLIIGAGGLGCPVLQYLTAAGIGTIGIIDDDVVEKSNLQRQVLYTYDDIGMFKTDVAVKRLKGLNPFVNFKTYPERLTRKNAISLFKKFDIVVDGSDNFPTRYLTNDASVITNKPLIFGSIFKFEGQVSVFNYKDGPTYRCLFPNPPKPNQVPNCSQTGVISVLPGIIGCLMANEVLKIICGIGDVLSGKLLIYNTLTMNRSILKFKKDNTIDIKSLEPDYNFFCGMTPQNDRITLKTLKENPHKYNLLDVREYHEREQYNIGGQHIPLGELSVRLDEVIRDKDLVVYCKSGYRSSVAIELLRKSGFEKQLLNLSLG